MDLEQRGPSHCISPSWGRGSSSGAECRRRVCAPQGMTVGKRWRHVQTKTLMHKRDNMEVDRLIKKIVKEKIEGSSANYVKKKNPPHWKSQSWQQGINHHILVCCYIFPKNMISSSLSTCWLLSSMQLHRAIYLTYLIMVWITFVGASLHFAYGERLDTQARLSVLDN